MKNLIRMTLANGAEKAEAYYQNQNIEEIIFENSQLKQISRKKLHGVYLRALRDGKIGSLATSDLSKMDDHAKKVVEIASFGDKLNYDFNKVGMIYPKLNLVNPQAFSLATDEIVTSGEETIAQIDQYDKNIKVNLNVYRVQESKEIYNSHNLELTTNKDDYYVHSDAFLVDGDNFIRVSAMRIAENGLIDFSSIASELIEKIRIARTTVTIESGKYPVILTPEAVAQVVFALEAFKGDTIAKNISPLKDKLHTQLFAEALTIVDDGTYEGGFSSNRFDDEGTPMQKTILVKDGILENFILNLESASELQVKPTGNGLKSSNLYSNQINESFSNLIFTPGKTSFEEMIKEIKVGVIIEDIFGLILGNLLQGNIDSDMDMAYKIQDGRIVGRVKNGAIGTNVYKLFKDNFCAVGNKLIQTNYQSAVFAPHIFCKDIYLTFA